MPSTLSIRFDVFELDPRAGELRKHGLRVKIQEKPLRVLEALLSRPDEVVTRDELRGLLWPADTFVDFEGGLNTAVNKVRVALGDSADSPRFIETVGRRGYRFIAPVERMPGSSAPISPRAELEQALQPPEADRRSAQVAVLRSLAVLPFANAAGDPQLEYLCDGLTESIIFNLSQLPDLRVMARSAVFRHKGGGEDALHIGKTLGVEGVVSGHVRQRGETLLISAELTDVENGWQMWGTQYRRPSEDIFKIEDDIANEISDRLRLSLTPAKQSLLARRRTDNVEAYHLYLKGRFHWGKRTEDGLHKGLQYFRQAIEADPTYALAHAFLGEGYIPLAVYGHLAPAEAVPKAKAAALRAVEIEPELPEALTVLGETMAWYDWDLRGAEQLLRKALALDPTYPRARQALSECLTKRFTSGSETRTVRSRAWARLTRIDASGCRTRSRWTLGSTRCAGTRAFRISLAA